MEAYRAGSVGDAILDADVGSRDAVERENLRMIRVAIRIELARLSVFSYEEWGGLIATARTTCNETNETGRKPYLGWVR